MLDKVGTRKGNEFLTERKEVFYNLLWLKGEKLTHIAPFKSFSRFN